MAVYTIKVIKGIFIAILYLVLIISHLSVYVLFSPEYVTSKETPFLVKSTFEF